MVENLCSTRRVHRFATTCGSHKNSMSSDRCFIVVVINYNSAAACPRRSFNYHSAASIVAITTVARGGPFDVQGWEPCMKV